MNQNAMDRQMGSIRLEFHPLKRSLLVGLMVALCAQFNFSIIFPDFRISFAVVLLPFLLVTIATQIHTLHVCFFSAVIVFLFRFILLLLDGNMSPDNVLYIVPGALFYFVYGCLFKMQIRNKHTATAQSRNIAFFVCDAGANIIEILIRAMIHGSMLQLNVDFGMIILIAAVRTVLLWFLLFIYDEHRKLRIGAEQEQRYQRLFLIISEMKNELYFMRKNSDEIEEVMGNAYRLHEFCQNEGLSEEIQQMTLDIARNVHEIKKDYFRVMQGLEEEIGGEYSETEMHFRDILEILRATSYQLAAYRKLDVHIFFDCRDDFLTEKHYELMTILKNLVSNSIEAIETDKRSGDIYIRERRNGDQYSFEVEDNGPGITEKQMKRIFRMGYSTKYDGVTGNMYRGVGLSGVKNLVEEQLGGEITAESSPGEKTVFRITIPAKKIEK